MIICSIISRCLGRLNMLGIVNTVSVLFVTYFACFCVYSVLLAAQSMLSYLAFLGQMFVHSCLFVLLSSMSHIVYICTVLFEQKNDDE